MAKKKIFRNDGTEDFDAEAKEPDTASEDAGNVSDLIAQGGAEGAEGDKADAATDAPVTTDVPPAADDKAAEGSAEAPSAAAQQPELGEVVPEAKAAVELDPALAEALKDIGNKVTPLFDKFREADAKLHQLEDEAKVRFAHVRQKATEMVAALESWFLRG